MVLKVTADCICCGACDWCCANDAIGPSGETYSIDARQCTECEGEYPSPQCIDACPVDCIIPLEENEILN